MTPKEVCEYIVSGKIYDDYPSADCSYSELGIDIWPERFKKFSDMATEALKEENKVFACVVDGVDDPIHDCVFDKLYRGSKEDCCESIKYENRGQCPYWQEIKVGE